MGRSGAPRPATSEHRVRLSFDRLGDRGRPADLGASPRQSRRSVSRAEVSPSSADREFVNGRSAPGSVRPAGRPRQRV